MNLLKDNFISTTEGKVSLKTLLTTEKDYQLQYYFDETQLAMLQMLASLTTVLLKPSVNELRKYIDNGVTPEAYCEALAAIDSQWYESDRFMRSKAPHSDKFAEGPITKLISGIECGGSSNALGLFSEVDAAEVVCPDCTHVLNYNLHMNIKGECFGPSGATGIRGGGAISTLIAGKTLKETILANTVAVDFFERYAHLDNPETRLMWDLPPTGEIYPAQHIGLARGLFALAYHIDFPVIEEPCVCDVCGHPSQQSVKQFLRQKYLGSYGSTKKGRDNSAGWWPHPFTPVIIKEEGTYPVSARDQHWQSWQELSSYVVGKEVDKGSVKPAFIVYQFKEQITFDAFSLLIGGNIAEQGSILGRVYDLYAMPASLNKNLKQVTSVIDAGLTEKDKLSRALNKLFGGNYDKHFVGGIKEQTMQRFVASAQKIVQATLLDVNRTTAEQLRITALKALNAESISLYQQIMKKYEHNLPLYKALVKGERVLLKNEKVKALE